MSYDLSFRFRDAASHVDEEELRDYFQARPHYQCGDKQAWYSNETTGVYFCFDFGFEEPDPEELEECGPPDPHCAPVLFNINYCRPHYFALEAEPELSSFVRHFDLLVSDPQVHGMGEGEYTPEGFLRGWNAGNLSGYQALVQAGISTPAFMLPADTLEHIWRWNFTRDERQQALTDEIFVPKIFLFDVSGALKTGVAWGDAVPILMPQVDVVIAPRKMLAPRKFFQKREDMVFFTMAELTSILSRFPLIEDHLPARRLSYSQVPLDLERLFRSKSPLKENIKSLRMDEVLDEDLYDHVSIHND
jgi:hypothetical protein